MSTTEDFTGRRKTAVERNFHLRGTTSSVKKRPFFPKQLIPLAPLDLEEIRREILEAENEDSGKSDCVTKNRELNNSLDLPCDTKVEDIEASNTFRENLDPVKNVLVKKVNDSFDFDFSPLSLQTPSKKYTSVETPDYKKRSCNKDIDKFDNFVTPTVKAPLQKKICGSVSINTPKSISASKQVVTKPEINQNNIVCSIPRKVPPDNTFSKLNINNTEYLILNILGKGGSSVVYQCFCLEKKTIVAIKCVCLENTMSAQGFINEVKLLQRLQNCDRIIKLYDYQILQEEKKLMMVLEKGGDDFGGVLKNLASQKKNIPLYMLVFYWMEMLLAVKQIHSNGIIHSDLKPSNFLSGDKGLKLIDFGIACSVQSDMTSVFKCLPEGSCNYMSPEALNNDATSPNKSKYKLHYKSDVWSLGCILYELIYKKTPFQHFKVIWTKLAHIMNPNHTIEYPEVQWLPAKVIDTCKKCLQYNFRDRPSVDELIAEFDAF